MKDEFNRDLDHWSQVDDEMKDLVATDLPEDK